MTNVARAHTFAAWFTSTSMDRVGAAVSDEGACITIFDRYPEEVWAFAVEPAVNAEQDVSAFLSEYFGFDMIDSLALLKASLVRFACERLALAYMQPVAA